MSDLLHIFKGLRRPGILIRAARIAVAGYQRDKDLRRVLKSARLPSPARGLADLLLVEQEMEATRQTGGATYSISRHVEVLAALIAEAGILRKTRTH